MKPNQKVMINNTLMGAIILSSKNYLIIWERSNYSSFNIISTKKGNLKRNAQKSLNSKRISFKGLSVLSKKFPNQFMEKFSIINLLIYSPIFSKWKRIGNKCSVSTIIRVVNLMDWWWTKRPPLIQCFFNDSMSAYYCSKSSIFFISKTKILHWGNCKICFLKSFDWLPIILS